MGFSRRHRFYFVLVALWLTGPALAASDAQCQREQAALNQWREGNERLEQHLEHLDAALAGEPVAPAALTDALGAAPTGSAPPPSRVPAAVVPGCDALAPEYKGVRERTLRLTEQRRAKRLQWFELADEQRLALTTWHELYQNLAGAPAEGGSDDYLRERLAGLIALTPLLRRDPAAAVAALDGVARRPGTPPWLSAAEPAQEMLWRRQSAEAQRQVLAVRASLWEQVGSLSLLTERGGLDAALSVIDLETGLAVDRLYQAFQLTFQEGRLNGEMRRYLPLLSNALALLLGIALFAVLIHFSRRGKSALLSLHARVMEASGGRRWLWNLSRLVAGLAPLLPWLIPWFALDLVEPALQAPSTRLLLWLVPLARLYVVFGLTWLIGEWLVLRVAQGAGTYLNGEQANQAGDRARRVAVWLTLPWALFLAVDQLLGGGLLHGLTGLLLGLALYAAIGRLLTQRGEDYLVCLQSILPSRLDPLAARLLHKRLFSWTAPLLLPVALVYFVFRYLDQLLAGADWYLRLKARWFRMRAQSGDEDEKTEDDTQPAREYQQWFDAGLPDDEPAPFIDTGLTDAMEKAIQRWREDKTDENTLLVAGEKGSGKSMAARRLTRALEKNDEGLRVVSVSVPAKTLAPEEVIALVAEALDEPLEDGPASLVKNDEQRRPTLLILDEAQNFFLARIGGLEGWRTLLRLTNARLDNLFWLVLLNNQSWAYLCNVFGREYQFRNVVRVKRWGQSEIRSLILSRHHLSGQTLRYDEVLLSSRGPEAGNVRNAEQRYFSLLWDACRGNPMAALRLWLSSVKITRRQVLVGLPAKPQGTAVEKAGENLLFVYAAIATHENLSSGEIVAATDLPENVVRYALKAGFDAGFIRQSDDGRYRMVPLWYHTVINHLTRKNLLHE
ncbi:MAG: ATP-binding protein [Alloalcanivorax venustensis]